MPGQHPSILDEIPTPFILVDEGVVKNNLHRIHHYAHRHGLSVRGHVKTHKSLALARMQMETGDVGIAVAKAEEAEVMADGLGNVDITVAYPAVGKARAEKIARLARTHPIGVAVDSEYVMEGLEDAATAYGVEIGISVMLDAGLHRCGVSDPQALVKLGEYARQSPSLRYEGIQMYVGHLYGEAADDPASFERINRIWDPAYESLCSAELTPERVSSGSTPSLFNTHRIHHVNEIRVGTAVLNDYFVLKFGHCRMPDCALRVLATVISRQNPGAGPDRCRFQGPVRQAAPSSMSTHIGYGICGGVTPGPFPITEHRTGQGRSLQEPPRSLLSTEEPDGHPFRQVDARSETALFPMGGARH